MNNYSFIIVAGGKGSRMGQTKKQFLTLGNLEVWNWSANTASELHNNGIKEIVLVIPTDSHNLKSQILNDWDKNIPLKIVFGGNERAISVLNGLEAAENDFVMVHDAARPFVTKNLLIALMNATDENTGVIPLLPVSDALKKVDNNQNISSVNRDSLYATQTPQSFNRLRLINAVKKYPLAKDEAEAWLSEGLNLKYVDGEKLNFKITWHDDMKIAESLVSQKIIRTGIGWDIHRLVPDRDLILGGVLIPSNVGLLGHSDADVLTHAIMDAILGAAGLPDIGNLFPAKDSKFKNANSLELLKIVLDLVHNDSWDIEWLDCVIQAQIPKLNAYIPDMKKNLTHLFDSEIVNIKAKSAEFIDDSGAGLSMTCNVIATLSKKVGLMK